MTCWLCEFDATENAQSSTCKNGPCQICVQIANTNQEINEAVVGLRRLLAKRCNLRSERNHIHGSLVHRLPVELIHHIFEFLLPSQTEWGKIPRSEKPVMPPHLASICKSWRNIACSNPLLWSTIRITIGTRARSSDLSASSRISFVHDWILRSRTLPLTLYIVVRNTGGTVEEELKGVLDAINQCSNRWHSLSLDIPSDLLRVFNHHNKLQYHRLRRLQITGRRDDITGPVQLLNPTASPEKIAIRGVSFQSLRISWNNLSVAKVTDFDLEDLTQLLQHASRMTACHIFSPRNARNLSTPPIIHQRLKTLGLTYAREWVAANTLLGSLTLPNLQEFRTGGMGLLSPAYLPALVGRSSCPLVKIMLFGGLTTSHDLQPLAGVTDLGLDTVNDPVAIKKLLVEEYFPDLQHLILKLQPFLLLWDMGIISMLLDRKRPLSGAPNGRRLRKIIISEKEPAANLYGMWNSDVGEELKAMDITLTKCGFEILCPNEDG